MRKIKVHLVNGFADNNIGGNPAGIIFNADELSTEDKQVVAAKIGLSETAFVSNSSVADYKFDFFTPSKQIAHCGHATIAAFSYMVQQGYLTKSESSKETIDGNRRIIIMGDMVFMEQLAPKYTIVADDSEAILRSLNLNASNIIVDAAPIVVNTGNSFLLVGLRKIDDLKNIVVNNEIINCISEKYGLIGYYVYTMQTMKSGRDATARMFAPYYGIHEESATGMAAGPLATYCYDKLGIKKNIFLFEQGWFMNVPSPSLITIKLNTERDLVKNLLAGGTGRFIRSFDIEV